MKSFFSAGMAMLLVVAACAVPSQAAVVEFNGLLTSNNAPGGFFGDVPVGGLVFKMKFDVADGASPGAVGPGFLKVSGFPPNHDVLSGTATLNDAGVNDTISFIVSTGGPNPGTSLFTFTGDFITSNTIDQAAMDGLLGSSAGFNYIDGFSGVVYQGRITAVPEPTMGLASLGLALGFVAVRRRKR